MKGFEKKINRETPKGPGTRTQPSTHAKKDPLYKSVETVKWQVGGLMVNILWDGSTDEELAKFKKPCTHGEKDRLPILFRRLMDFVKHVYREHNRAS